jgi:hypothetical protein
MLPKRLIARRVLRAAVFVSSIVGSQVSTEPGAGHEALPTARMVTYVVSDPSMCAFDMVIQMRCAEERLVTLLECALEDSLIVMGAQVFLKSRWPVECLCATIEGTAVSFQLRRIFS